MLYNRDGFSRSFFQRVIILIIFFMMMWLITLFIFVAGLQTSVSNITEKTDAIIVLTGGSQRLTEGLKLLEKKLSMRLFISGVYKGTEVRSLLNLFSFPNKKQAAFARQIEIGNALNTRENASETRLWVMKENLRSLRLVTAAYHMPRSLIEFRHVMPTVKIISNPVFPEHVKHAKWWTFYGTALLLASEYNKFLFAWLRQTLERFFR